MRFLYPIIASLLRGIVHFLNIYSWLIVINTTLTLFTRPKDKTGRLKQLLKKMTDPVNNIFRKLLRRMGAAAMPVDISPLLSLIAIWVVSRLLYYISELYFEFFYRISNF